MSQFGPIHCEIITIGEELLLGQIQDTNSTYLAQELGRAGISVRYRTTAGDRLQDMDAVFREALKRCDLVLCTGGLGPTEDDLTRQAVAGVAGVDLEFRQELMAQIEEMFARTGYKMSENNRRQAYVPGGSHPIPNPMGTAPGFIAEVDGIPIICLPGVPRELRYLLQEAVIPWIRRRYGLEGQIILYRVLKVVGIAESKVDTLIGDLMQAPGNPEVGLLSSPGEIKIRLTARADDARSARALIDPLEEILRDRLGNKIYGIDEDTLEGVIHGLLQERGLCVNVLETFTGGRAAAALHRFPSGCVKRSLVIPREEDLGASFLRGHAGADLPTARGLADILMIENDADVALVSLGFPVHRNQGVFLRATNVAKGEGFENVFSWEMGGDIPLIQQRGAVIALNTLRLGLLKTG